MSPKNLLNIDPDRLFQEHTIAEIDDTQKKLLHEIERKREELRVMVGERYRDLIDAADTIGEMKITANNCIKHLDSMTVTCRQLHNTHLIGFKTEHTLERPAVNKTLHGVAIQIKILMVIPEQIWSSLDTEDYLTATQLYLFARHIYTGLQLQTGGNKSLSGLMPVAQKQWNTLANFSQLLTDSCNTKLGNTDLEAQAAACCLASLFLLNSKESLVNLMNTFITLHGTNTLSAILKSEMTAHDNVKDDIKKRIATSLKVIIKTMQLLYTCFIENESGLIVEKLRALFQKNSPPLINLVKFNDPKGMKLLPAVVADYRLSSETELKSVTKAELSSCTSSWMMWVKEFSSVQVESLLKYVNNTKSLHTVREEAMEIDIPAKWPEICSASSIDYKKYSIWSKYFQPLITNRTRDIISAKWSQITVNMTSSIDKMLIIIDKPGYAEKEINLNWFVWNDLIGQSFLDSEEDIIKSINNLMKGMSMQDCGFTPNLEKLCLAFDTSLMSLLEDVRIYLYGQKNNKNAQYCSLDDDMKNIFTGESSNVENKYADREEIETFMRSCSKQNIEDLIQYISKECIEQISKDIKLSDIRRKSSVILTARLLQALPQLSPNLRLCFIPRLQGISSDYTEYRTADKLGVEAWEEVCASLETSCFACWDRWIEMTVKQIDVFVKEMPDSFTTAANVDYLLVQWDSIKIEEKDDQDQPVTSTIKIPAGPSMRLQKFLYSSSRVLDEVIPHTLPKTIHRKFIETVADKILGYFMNVVTEKADEINQKCALQLLMDVRHLTLILVSRENKKALNDSHVVCDLLKQKIDPFDYDVFYPRLQNNAKRSVQRVQTLLGSLIPNHDQLNSILGPKPLLSGGSADKDPNAFMLANQLGQSTAWFPLLHVTAPMSAARKSNDKQRKKQGQTLGSPGTNTAVSSGNETSSSSGYSSSGASNLVRSGAAFFGSMTSEWWS